MQSIGFRAVRWNTRVVVCNGSGLFIRKWEKRLVTLNYRHSSANYGALLSDRTNVRPILHLQPLRDIVDDVT